MNFESKYNFGDRVYAITNKQRKDVRNCKFCDGKGIINGANNEQRDCPECYGKQIEHYWINEGWRLAGQLTIGEVRFCTRWEQPGCDPYSIFSNYGPQEGYTKEEYMCLETGIGSGSVYDVSRLFASKKEAQKECHKRNEESEVGNE